MVQCSFAGNNTILKIFILLCGLFSLMLGLFIYQTYTPSTEYESYDNYERETWNARNRTWNERNYDYDSYFSYTIPTKEEIEDNGTNADDHWELDQVYYGDDLLSAPDGGLQRYRLHTLARTWFEALTTCWKEGGRLATPRDVDESRLLGRLVRAAMDTGNITNTKMKYAMHVGFNTMVTQKWTTLEGEQVKNMNCLEKRCSTFFQTNCAIVLSNGRITSNFCGEKFIYTCDMEQQNRSSDNEETWKPITNDGYERIGDASRYSLHKSPLSWLDALEVCENEGGYLMVPQTRPQLQRLSGWFTPRLPRSLSKGGVVLGINNLRKSYSWSDTQGENIVVRYLDPKLRWDISGSEIVESDERCAALLPNASLKIISCNEPKPFICEKKIPEYVREKVEYGEVEGLGRYALHTIPRDWEAAVLQCFYENASLAVPDSPWEAQVFTDIYSNCTECSSNYSMPNFLWVGINDMDSDQIWRKLSGEKTYGSDFNEWNPRQYSKFRSKKCGGLQNGTFVAEDCTKRNVFICEKSI